MTIQEKIKVLRKERGLKQSQLAELCRVSDAAIGAWEQGERIPYFDNLVSLADVFNVSLDVFRQDAKSLDLPHPRRKGYITEDEDDEEDHDDRLSYNDVPLSFGSKAPDIVQSMILDFCNEYLDSLDEQFFIKGIGQNNEGGTGRYFWESKIDILMFIGFTSFLQDDEYHYAFSIAMNTAGPVPEEYLSSFDCLQFASNSDENWIYFPIKNLLENKNDAHSAEIFVSAKKALLNAMELNRILLKIEMQNFLDSQKE